MDACETRKLSARFLKSLGLKDCLFNRTFDMCYCDVCHKNRGDQEYYVRGKPAKIYALPIGWYRFALKVPARTESLESFNEWYRCYHGVEKTAIKSILDHGELLQPGDIAMGGMSMGERDGHFNDGSKPSGFDTKQIFMSPSIRYSGSDAYATPFEYADAAAGKTYTTRVAFQLLMRPGSYQTGPETIGATEKIDPRFNNEELEWSTKERGATILYGLLVKLTEDSTTRRVLKITPFEELMRLGFHEEVFACLESIRFTRTPVTIA